MRKPLIAANWKMHGNTQSIEKLIIDLKKGLPEFVPADIVICPSFPYLSYVKNLLKGSLINLGAQDCSAEAEGALTGQVSAGMLSDVGCRYVIVGHSERRHLCAEDDNLIAKKFQAALSQQLIPILCVGETRAEFDQGRSAQVVLSQINTVLQQVGIQAFNNAIIAYEPVWAIGTGLAATVETIQQVHCLIRTFFTESDALIAANLLILYGGSVKIHNAVEIFSLLDVDGGLIGGASLDASTFAHICQAVL